MAFELLLMYFTFHAWDWFPITLIPVSFIVISISFYYTRHEQICLCLHLQTHRCYVCFSRLLSLDLLSWAISHVFSYVTEKETQSLYGMQYACVTCCCHTSTPYSEKLTPLAFQLLVHYGWSFLLMKQLLKMTKLLWSETASWCKEFIQRY